MISREVELEKMRRAKPKVSGDFHQEVIRQKELAPTSESTALPNHLQRLIPKAIQSTKPSVVVSR